MAKVGSLYVGICLQKGWGRQRGVQHDAAGTSFPCCVGSTLFCCSVLKGTAAVASGASLFLERLFERRFPLGSEFQFFVASEGNDSFGEAEETSGGGQERDCGGISNAGIRPEGQHFRALLFGLQYPHCPRPASLKAWLNASSLI